MRLETENLSVTVFTDLRRGFLIDTIQFFSKIRRRAKSAKIADFFDRDIGRNQIIDGAFQLDVQLKMGRGDMRPLVKERVKPRFADMTMDSDFAYFTIGFAYDEIHGAL